MRLFIACTKVKKYFALLVKLINIMKRISMKIILTIIIVSGCFTMISSCTKERKTEQEGENVLNENNNNETSLNVLTLITIDSLSKEVSLLIYEIGQLDSESFCLFNSIINTPVDNMVKVSQLSSITTFYNIISKMNQIDSFVLTHPELENNLLEIENKIYFGNAVLNYLGYEEVDYINIPNCNAYRAGINNCAYGFATCLLGAAFTGPAAGLMASACGISLLFCVNAMDAAYPDCVPTGSSSIKQLWSPKINNNCM